MRNIYNSTRILFITALIAAVLPGICGIRPYATRINSDSAGNRLLKQKYPYPSFTTGIKGTSPDSNNHFETNSAAATNGEIHEHKQQQQQNHGLITSRRKWLHRCCMSSLPTCLIMSTMAGPKATTAAVPYPSIQIASSTTAIPIQQQFNPEEIRRIAIFERTSPSVVFIDTFIQRRDSLTTNAMDVPLGSGSGFVWDKEGHIVTNYHVVQNAQSAQVTILLSGPDATIATEKIATMASSSDDTLKILGGSAITASGSNGRLSSNNGSNSSGNTKRSGSNNNVLRRVFTAKIVGVDPGKDIAVLKIDADPTFLFPILVGTSSGLKVGQQAMAIGNPFGLDHTLTVGVISGTGREVRSPIGRPITDVIQSDAAINPGNSGGPLLDSSGRLIGMNTAIYSPTGASAGIGFAIPVDAVQFIVNTLIRDGQVVRAILGISLLGSKQARTLGINSGVLVLDVPPDSPADKAGLKGTRRTESGFIELGDIITQVNQQVIDVEADLFQALEDLKPGDIVEVQVSRIVANNDELQMKQMQLYIKLQPSAPVLQRSFGTSSSIQQQQQQQLPPPQPYR